MARGLSDKLIARETGMALGTVKVHHANLLRKIGCRERVQAALLWHGIVV